MDSVKKYITTVCIRKVGRCTVHAYVQQLTAESGVALGANDNPVQLPDKGRMNSLQ